MTRISESRPFAEAAKPSATEGLGRLRIAIMTPGWGSSGYYSSDVCEAAGTERVFPAGTHMYINHPTATEDYERPVRDLTLLAAVVAEDPVWNAEEQELQAEVDVFSTWRQPISEMAKHIGVSIRAGADVTEGSAEGRQGTIITRLTEGLSIDFVTKAGRGGKILEVVEDAFGAGRAASTHVTEALNGDVRERLQDLVRDAHRTDDDTYLYAWVRDFDGDANVVYFEVESSALNGTYQQSYETGTDDIPTGLTGSPVEVRVATSYVPVETSGQSTSTEESLEDTMPQIEEARLRVLEEAEARNATLQTELAAATARAETAEESSAALRSTANTATAQRVVEAAFTAAEVTAPNTVARIAANPPLLESGLVDEEALTTIATESATEIAEARGDGRVRGLGEGSDDDSGDLSEEALDAELAKLSGRTTVKEG